MRRFLLWGLWVGLLITSTGVYAAINREMDYAIVQGSELLSFWSLNLRIPVDELRLYRYNQASDSWQAIPFQIDERDNGTFFTDAAGNVDIGSKNGFLDSGDELVFMVSDIGDIESTGSSRPADPVAARRQRWQIEIRDTSQSPAQTGYAYLFWSSSLAGVNHSYVSYKSASTDTVRGATYTIAHRPSEASGLPTAMWVPSDAGGDSIDFFKYHRLRITLTLNVPGFGQQSIDIKENMDETIFYVGRLHVFQAGSPNVVSGPIRILRRNMIKVEIEFPGSPIRSFDMPVELVYYPHLYVFDLSGLAFKLDMLADYDGKVTKVKLTQALSPEGFGMIYYNSFIPEKSTAIRINDEIHTGTPGSGGVDLEATDWPGKHWYAEVADPAYSKNGKNSVLKNNATLFTLLDLRGEPVGDGQVLYFIEFDYKDDALVYGDAGLWLNGYPPDYIGGAGNDINMDLIFNHYVLNQNLSLEALQSLFDVYSVPLQKSVSVYNPDTTPPDQITTLSVTGKTDNSISLSWLAVADDGSDGDPVAVYYVRYNTEPYDEENKWDWWAGSTPVLSSPTPSEPGQLQTLTVDGLQEGQLYYFAVRAGDEENNFSEISVVTSSATTPVELVGFSARAEQNRVYLHWSTASESNNHGFEIERKLDKNGRWERVDFVSGAGTTTSRQVYSWEERIDRVGKIFYRLRQLDTDGSFTLSDVVTVTLAAPKKFSLEQNYPNPFNPSTTIAYQLPVGVSGRVTLTVYNMLGRRIRTLVDKEAQPGYRKAEWDGKDQSGMDMPSGVYFCLLSTSGYRTVVKMVKME